MHALPVCGAAITFVWWQRFLIAGFTLFLTFVPISLRLRGTTLLFAAVLPVFPSLVVAIIINLQDYSAQRRSQKVMRQRHLCQNEGPSFPRMLGVAWDCSEAEDQNSGQDLDRRRIRN